MKRRAIILSGIFGVFLGIAMILPALGTHHKHPESWTGGEIKGLLFGIIVAIAGVSAALYGRARPLQPNKTFTFVELLAAIAVIGVLAMVLLPLF